MCIAILNLEKELSEDVFRYSFANNPDGIGIAYIVNGKIKTSRSMTSYLPVYQDYLKARSVSDLPIMIHSRIGTSGSKDLSNCHPFLITPELAFCHNGIIRIDEIDKTASDTVHFVRFLRTLKNPEMVLDPFSYEYLIADALADRSSKFIFLSVTGEWQIINDHMGDWIDGTWYSNGSYKESQYVYYGNQKVKKGSAYNYGTSLWGEWNDDVVGKPKACSVNGQAKSKADGIKSERMLTVSKKMLYAVESIEEEISLYLGYDGILTADFYHDLNDLLDYYGYACCNSKEYKDALEDIMAIHFIELPQ